MKKYKVPPTPGHYWVRDDTGLTIVCYMRAMGSNWLYVIGSEESISFKDFEWYYGPIPEPDHDAY